MQNSDYRTMYLSESNLHADCIGRTGPPADPDSDRECLDSEKYRVSVPGFPAHAGLEPDVSSALQAGI